MHYVCCPLQYWGTEPTSGLLPLPSMVLELRAQVPAPTTARLPSYLYSFSASHTLITTHQSNLWKALLSLALLFQASLQRESSRIWGEGRGSLQGPFLWFQGPMVQPHLCDHLHYETMVSACRQEKIWLELTSVGTEVLKESRHKQCKDSGWYSKCSVSGTSSIFLPAVSDSQQVSGHVGYMVTVKPEGSSQVHVEIRGPISPQHTAWCSD